jgi:HD-like signal output (HDOD) protein
VIDFMPRASDIEIIRDLGKGTLKIGWKFPPELCAAIRNATVEELQELPPEILEAARTTCHLDILTTPDTLYAKGA